MQTLLTAIVTWLSINFGLPGIHDHPRIEFVTPAQMSAIRLSEKTAAQSAGAAVEGWRVARGGSRREIEALYDDSSRTIFLREGWTGATPAEVSIIVHEMVHHLQNLGGLKYECPQAREELAYLAQNRWLARSRSSLQDEFKLDPFTLLLRTKCMH